MERTWRLTVAGMLDIIASACGLFFVGLVFETPPYGVEKWSGDFWSYVAIFLVLAIPPLIGGILALQGKRRKLALAGSIFPILFTPLGIVATVFVATSSYNGQSQTKGQGVTDPGKAAVPKTSRAWWLLPIFLVWVGGLIGYFVLRERDRAKAKLLLLLGIFIFAGVPLSFAPLLLWL